MLRHVTIEKFADLSGYTPDAVRSKIKRGDWLQGFMWIKAPDGRNLIDLEGYEKWATGAVFSQHQQAVSASVSAIAVSRARNESSYRQRSQT